MFGDMLDQAIQADHAAAIDARSLPSVAEQVQMRIVKAWYGCGLLRVNQTGLCIHKVA